MITARLFNCPRCHSQVILCSDCDRGNIYCGSQCSHSARQASLAAAGKRYQATYRGRIKHALRQQRYRQRQYKKVTHQTFQVNTDKAPSLVAGMFCHFCNKQVSNYLRLDFLRYSSWRKDSALHAYPQAP